MSEIFDDNKFEVNYNDLLEYNLNDVKFSYKLNKTLYRRIRRRLFLIKVLKVSILVSISLLIGLLMSLGILKLTELLVQ